MMESVARMGSRPVSLPLVADDVVEFHAARLLLLFELCGVAGRIDGLTKMAKLDFFVRYPEFYALARGIATSGPNAPAFRSADSHTVESVMIRHHYGPWDKRYYQVLAHLESRGLITVGTKGKQYRIALTPLGRDKAQALASEMCFIELADRMRDVKKVFGTKSGSALKNLVYELFDEEVGQLPLGKEIRQ